MATQVTNYQCPACTGPMHFVGASGRLECDYCGSSYSVEEIEKLYAGKEEKAAAAFAQAEEKAAAITPEEREYLDAGNDWPEGMKAYNCPSCSAELVCDATTAATSCPYCGNPTVIPGQFSGMMKPDCIIPFKIGKEQAIAALKNHYKGKRLLPKEFSDQNHLKEIKGVYVPFWLFDSVVDADVTFHAETSVSYTEGDYDVTEISHYDVRRAGTVAFEKVPADASTKMPDDYMDSIEPYHYEEFKPFSSAYLPGFLADKYDVSKEDCAERANSRAMRSAVDEMKNTVVGYSSVVVEGQDVNLHPGKARYALMPVWLLSTRWQDKSYLFAMNGQTGKLVGDLPVSKKRALQWFGAIAGALAAVMAVIVMLMG